MCSKKLNDYLPKKVKPTLCSTCKNIHPIHMDGYEYLDCMLFIKKRDNEKKKSTNTTIEVR